MRGVEVLGVEGLPEELRRILRAMVRIAARTAVPELPSCTLARTSSAVSRIFTAAGPSPARP